MPDASVFLDSNTLLYTIDEFEDEKVAAAQMWLRALAARGCGVTNLQVLNKLSNVLTRKAKRFAAQGSFESIDAFACNSARPR